jgi:anti-sigma regulatory factor (Ser/Thr protein kinase)
MSGLEWITMPGHQMIEIHSVAQLAAVRHDLSHYLESHSLPAETTYDVLTCVQEASKNALRFAASPQGVQVSVCVANEEILVTIRDHGAGLDLEAVRMVKPDVLSESGRGLFLLEALMDEVEFRVADGTEVRLHKLLATPATRERHVA